jgi:ATP-dependent DNA ligase
VTTSTVDPFDFATMQDCLRSGHARVHGLVATEPAAYVVFDLLARNGKGLRDRLYGERRRKLEKLLGEHLPDGLVLPGSPPIRPSRACGCWPTSAAAC